MDQLLLQHADSDPEAGDKRVLSSHDAHSHKNGQLDDSEALIDPEFDESAALRSQFCLLWCLTSALCFRNFKHNACAQRCVLVAVSVAVLQVFAYLVYEYATHKNDPSVIAYIFNVSVVLTYGSIPFGYYASMLAFRHDFLVLLSESAAERGAKRRCWTNTLSVFMFSLMLSYIMPLFTVQPWAITVAQWVLMLPSTMTTLLLLFHMRLVSEKIDRFNASIPSLPSADDLLTQQIQLRRLVARTRDAWHTFYVLGFLGTTIFSAGLIIVGYFDLAMSAGKYNPSISAASILIALMLFIMIALILLGVADINDKNKAIRLTIIDNKLFSHTERHALLYQLELEPVSFTIVGVQVSVGAIARLVLTVCGAFVPLLVRTVLGIK